jgi:hypothetical protein
MPVLLLLAACAGGASPETANPSAGPQAVVDNFLQAAKDSNLARMADLWGTASGPASRTHVPPDYLKRIEIIQIYLDHDTRRFIAISDVEDEPDQKRVLMELRRGNCVNRVPFVAAKLSNDTWLVRNADIATVGNPARRCDERGNPI